MNKKNINKANNLDNIVLITGASTGIGFSCLEIFLKYDWHVIAHFYENTEKFINLLDSIYTNNITPIESDFSDESSFEKFLQEVKIHDVNALVNSAGVYDHSKKSDNRIESAKNVFLTNTIAPIIIAETVIENMKVQKKGSIVNISSIGVKYGTGLENIFYGASKIGLEAATRSLAREGAPYNILVNALRPGITDTEFYPKIGKDITERVKLIPLKRAASPLEIAQYIYYLCNDNTFITNEVLSIAGGE